MAKDPVYGLSAANVEKIRAGLRATEAISREMGLGGGGGASGRGLIRIRIGKAVSDVDKGSVGDFYLCNGDHTEAQVGGDSKVKAKSVGAKIKEGKVAILLLAENVKWYAINADSEDDSCSEGTLGGQDVTKFASWDKTRKQVLGHDENGCMIWITVEECPTT